MSLNDDLLKIRNATSINIEGTVLNLLEERHTVSVKYLEECSVLKKELIKNQIAIMLALRLIIQND